MKSDALTRPFVMDDCPEICFDPETRGDYRSGANRSVSIQFSIGSVANDIADILVRVPKKHVELIINEESESVVVVRLRRKLTPDVLALFKEKECES